MNAIQELEMNVMKAQEEGAPPEEVYKRLRTLTLAYVRILFKGNLGSEFDDFVDFCTEELYLHSYKDGKYCIDYYGLYLKRVFNSYVARYFKMFDTIEHQMSFLSLPIDTEALQDNGRKAFREAENKIYIDSFCRTLRREISSRLSYNIIDRRLNDAYLSGLLTIIKKAPVNISLDDDSSTLVEFTIKHCLRKMYKEIKDSMADDYSYAYSIADDLLNDIYGDEYAKQD